MTKNNSQNNSQPNQQKGWVPKLLIAIALVYLSLVIYIPTVNVFIQAFKKGVEPFFPNAIDQPHVIIHAQLTFQKPNR